MKTKRVQQIAVAVMMLCAAGCSQELIDTPSTKPQGELVEVSMDFNVEGFFSPANDDNASATSKATSEVSTARVIHSERSGGMLVELVESPIVEPQPDTRAVSRVDENKISNVWVFQYNGEAETDPLVQKSYYASYTTGQAFELVAGTNQRVVVVVNAGSTFGDDQTKATSTYQTLLDKSQAIATEADLFNDNLTPMSGTTCDNVSADTNLRIELRRNVAKVCFRVKLGDDYAPAANTWKIQMCDVPNISYWMPHRVTQDSDMQPAATAITAPVSYAEEVVTAMTTAFSEFNWFVPMNHRGVVAGTTSKQRKTKAPPKSTYVKITGTRVSDVTTYTIHLGANFTTNYNLKPNYLYTYNATLYTDPDKTDSRVEVKGIGTYIGMLGGELKDNGSGVWAFNKKLYVDDVANEVSDKKWSTNQTQTDIKDTRYGKKNTLDLYKKDPSIYEAATVCMQKNTNYASITLSSDANYIWYLPAQEELMAAWVAHKSLEDVDESFGSNTYWSSSEYNSYNSWYVAFNNGNTSYSSYYKTFINRVRCVREVTP